MNDNQIWPWPKLHLTPLSPLLAIVLLVTAGCAAGRSAVPDTDERTIDLSTSEGLLYLPRLSPVELAPGEKIRILATTSILGDIVAQVGGANIELTILMKPGQDPHGYEASARDLTTASDAHAIFVNGWNLEQSLVNDLKNVADGVPIVPASAGIVPRSFDEGFDPHVWLDPGHVMKWVDNISEALTALDPTNEAEYKHNAETYLAQLQQLVAYAAEQIATIPSDKRIIVTNHDSLGYFADEYGLDVMGTVIPGADTLVEPSAKGLSFLVDRMVAAGICTIYAETTASDKLAQATAAELDECSSVQIMTLNTGALGLPGSGAEDYLSMMRSNIDVIVAGQNQR